MAELWDLYDKNRCKLNKTVHRGDYLNDDEYHLVVNAWIRNKNNEFLITQRSANKSYAFMWETTGGSALAGEDSIDAAAREIKEELGIDIDKSTARLVGTKLRYYKGCPDILDVWIFTSDVKITDVTIQEEEVNDVMWASVDTIKKMKADGKFESNAYFDEVMKTLEDEIYYIGFNANNAICNDSFFKGSITLYPTKEKGNNYYSAKVLEDTKSSEFMQKYHDFVYSKALELQKNNVNTYFICFNEKIRKLCSDMDNINIVRSNSSEVLDMLNNKFKTRDLVKSIVPILNYHILDDTNISYDELKQLVGNSSFVLQAESGAGGDSTYLINNSDDMNLVEDNFIKFCVSKYIKNTPLNTTLIIGKDDIIYLPPSVQLIKVTNHKFKYVGGDFKKIQSLDKKLLDDLKDYSMNIAKKVQKLNYRGVLGIDYVLFNNQIYFMEINPRFQASSFILSLFLQKSDNTDVAKLHYQALINEKLDQVSIKQIDYSFVNCNDLQPFSNLKDYEIIENGYFKDNKSSYYRKVFNRSIIEEDSFEKE